VPFIGLYCIIILQRTVQKNIKQETCSLGMTPYILIIGYYHLGYLQWGKMEAADPFETSKYTTTPSRGTQIDTHRRHNTDVTTPDVTRSGLHNSDWRTFPPGSSGESDSCVGY